MGTWSAQLDGNDYFVDVYEMYMEMHSLGKSSIESADAVMLEFIGMGWNDMMDDDDHEEELIEFLNTHDDNDEIEFFLALAKAQLDTGELHPYIFQMARLIIETGASLRLLEGLDADEEFLEERKQVLSKFLSLMTAQKDLT